MPERDCVPLPERLTFEQGAAIPVNYATAWAGLVGYGSLQPGERVLIHSAGGGVGIAATQIAKRFGAGEIYGTASPAKHERIRALGVDHVLDYKQASAKGELPRFDVILDPIGGKSLRTSYNLLRPGGRLVGVRRLGGRLGGQTQTRAGAAYAGAHAALLAGQADVGIEGGDRLEHAQPVEVTVRRSNRGSSRCASCSTTAPSTP